MKIVLIAFLFFFTSTVCFSQQNNDNDNLARSWPIDQLKKASIDKDVTFMNRKEKDVVLLCNLARMNGPFFVKTILKPYLDSKNMKSNRYIKSLIKTLDQQDQLPVLQADKLLYTQALSHAKKSGERGTTGHAGFEDRFKKAKKEFWNMAENCYYGHNDALEIALELLVDDGVSDLGHRKNMLSPDLGYVGVSIQPHHSVYEYNCVMDFGGKR